MADKFRKTFGFVSAFVEWLIIILLVVLIILTGFQRFSNQHNFFGYRMYIVASGSMIPTYNIGDTLLIKEMDASLINEGDAVTYMGEDPGLDGLIITHQVQKVEIIDGKYYFHTKGVANNIEDPIVSEDQVLGKVVYRFFLLSFIGRITTSKILLFSFVTIPIALLIAIEIIKLVYKKDDDEDQEDDMDSEKSLDNEESTDVFDDSSNLDSSNLKKENENIEDNDNILDEVDEKNNVKKKTDCKKDDIIKENRDE